MFYNPSLTWALRGILALAFLLAFALVLLAPEAYSKQFAVEDGPIEYLSAILLFAASLVLAMLARRTGGYRAVLIGVYALAFFWAAGEEVSWGQRIFGIESSQFFVENNAQGETNLHNLIIGDEHLAERVFGTGLAIVIMLYLVVLPLLYPRLQWVRSITNALAVPVPAVHIGVLAIIATLFSAWIGLERQWEFYEFCFSVFSCLVFLNPANGGTFGLAQAGD